MVEEDQLIFFVALDIVAVDLLARRLALPKRAHIEVVLQDPLHGRDAPCALDLTVVFVAPRFDPRPLAHARSGVAAIGQVIGDLAVAPALVIQPKNLTHDLRLARLDGKCHRLGVGHHIAVGHGADPPAVLLTAFDNISAPSSRCR